MKHRILLLLALLGLFFTSCWEAPQLPAAREVKVLAIVQAILDASGAASAQLMPNARSSRSALPDTAISFTRKFSSVFEDETSKQRYLNATFEVQNASGQDFKNLTLYAYSQAASSIGGTAIKKMVNFGLDPISSPSIAQNIKPTHGMKHVGADVLVNPDETDFQAFQWNEVNQVRDAARTLGTILNDDEVLEYGFVARSNLGGRAIGNNGKGYVTISVRLPKQTDKSLDPYKFVMTFVLADDAVTRVTRSAEESTTEVEARAAQLNASEVVLIGPDLDTVVGKTTIRVPNVKISTAPASLLESKLFIISVAPLEISNDQTTPITVTGQEFSADTSFFVESTKLTVTSINPNRATLNIPAGFEPANYGLMAVNPDGSRATLYPGFSIKAGTPARAIDSQLRARSFVDGYVIDYKTQQPLSEAKISLWNGTGTLEATTDVNGYFLIRGVPAGQNVFKIEHTGYASVYRNANVLGDAQTVTLALAALEPSNPNTKSIDATGGTYYANGLNPDGGFLVVPPGALDKPADIQFTQLHAPETMPELPQNNLFTAFAKLEPSGLVFKKPATLFLPIATDLNRTAGQKVPALYFDTQQSKWVNEITSGVISSINGKLFLEYEITHFSYGGGGVPCGPINPKRPEITCPDEKTISSVRGCVLYDDGTPANAMTTNWGITNPDGEFIERAPSLKPGSTQIAKVIGNGDAVPVTATVDESGSIDFPCIRIPRLTPGSPTKPSLDTVDPCQSPAPPINFGAPTPIQTRNQTRASSSSQLVTAQSLKGTTSEIPNYRKYNIDPSKTILTIGGVDFTSKAVIVPNPNNTENLLVTLVLPEPLKVLANLEFKLSVETREGKKAENSSFADVAAKLKAPKAVVPFIVPDNIPLTKPTPYTVEGSQGLLVVARASDAVNGFLNTHIPVKALDVEGQVLTTYSSNTALSFRNSVSNGSAKIVNGIALIPVKIPLNNAGKSTSLGHLFSLSSNNLRSSRVVQTRVAVSQFDDCNDAPAGTVGEPVKLDEPVTIYDTIASLPVVNQLLDWMNQTKDLEFEIAGLKFTYGDFVTLGWGLIPLLGDFTVIVDNAYNLLIGKGADPVEATLASVSFGFDLSGNEAAGAAGSAMIFVFKISKAGKGIFKDWIAAAIKACTEKPLKCFELLKKEFSYLIDLFKNGGSVALRAAEEQIARISANLAGGLADVRKALGRLVDFPALDALGNPITTERLLDVMDDVDDIPGFDRVVNKISTGNEGNIRGAFGELERAKGLKRLGATDIEFKGEVQFLDANGVTVKRDIDISYRDAQGNLIFEEVKSGNITSIYFDYLMNTNGRKNALQAQSFAEAARKNGAIPRWNVPDCSIISAAALTFLTVTGIEVYDANLGKC
jgi:hypothetical protein